MRYWILYDSANGAITSFPHIDVDNSIEWTNVPSGCAVMSVDQSDAAQWALVTDAIVDQIHLAHYTVQNGSLVKTVTEAQLLAEAQAAQLALIDQSYAATIAGGFQCAAGGTTYTFGWADEDQKHLMQVQQAVDKGIDTFPLPYEDISGNAVSIADQTTLTAIETAADHFDWAQVKQLRTLIGQVQAATTVAAVQSVTWSAAPY